jgi:hypothetical protein
VNADCYRLLTLEPKYVWTLGTRYWIPEAISSWTLQFDVAQHVKGGIAPKGELVINAIFRVRPSPVQVVLNLHEIYRDPEFHAACERKRSGIVGFGDGIGRYGDSQREVILELPFVELADVEALGEHSSDREGFLEQPHVRRDLARRPASARRKIVRQFRAGGTEFGPRWLRGARKDDLLRRWVHSALQIQKGAGG